MTKGLTKKQAIALAKTDWWKPLSHRDRAMFQMFEPLLCMPFDVFHEAVEKALGRPVWTHEFGLNADGLRRELLGEQAAPTMDEIIGLIPAEKRLVIIGSRA